ncbi:MAG TPA: folylpolyglutamate synthase/dihydrofolate synthase family protein [Candidatus Acidoferrales bacterium]|nr:folylpolyglutamate synthase/dihydrofolate synthase family protein [Candidatus Acidoferrales bacterium]
MIYPETIQFLYGLRLFGAKFGLENTIKLAALAGNPHQRLRFIHVAGTNGKGSTCAMLESIYRTAGLRVGLFTSPHLVSFRERIQINREWITEDEVVRLVVEFQPWLKQFTADHHPTFFEVVAVMALKFFADQNCELVIWETGLGGRLDATNIVTPLASIITNIAYDHQQWLGDTLEKIAVEKAGIIKPGVPVVTATDAAGALRVIEQAAREKGAPLTHIDSRQISRLAPRAALAGDHQQINAALALAAVESLQPRIPVSQESIRDGLARVSWPGRLQSLAGPGGQTVLLDGAHNPAGAAALRAALEKDFPGTPKVFIFGALADKKWSEICAVLAPLADEVFTVPVASDRTAAPADLAAAFRVARPGLRAAPAANLIAALNACKDRRFVVITGSLYLVGEALEHLGFSPAGAGERGLNEWTAPKIHR